MTITIFKLQNNSPSSINFPQPGSITTAIQVQWSEAGKSATNCRITYSVTGNRAGIKFSNSTEVYKTDHPLNSNDCILNDQLSFILSGTKKTAKQFYLSATITIEGTSKEDNLLILIKTKK